MIFKKRIWAINSALVLERRDRIDVDVDIGFDFWENVPVSSPINLGIVPRISVLLKILIIIGLFQTDSELVADWF